jgi:hypothetical protein
MTPEEAQAFLRRVMGPPKRRIEGEEYKHLMLILNLKTPIGSSNNQRFWTDEYEHNSRIYHITYGFLDDPYLEEVCD